MDKAEPDPQPGAAHDRSGALTPLAPAQVRVLATRSTIWVVALVLGAMMAAPWLEAAFGLSRWVPLGATALAGLAFVLVFPRRRYAGWGYREGEEEIEIAHGRLIRLRTIMPFGRVQHIDVAQGPIQRGYGLATLILHTAGTQGASVPLPGLRLEDAEAMRDRIRAKIRQDLA